MYSYESLSMFKFAPNEKLERRVVRFTYPWSRICEASRSSSGQGFIKTTRHWGRGGAGKEGGKRRDTNQIMVDIQRERNEPANHAAPNQTSIWLLRIADMVTPS